MKRSLFSILALLSAGFGIYALLYLFEGTAPAFDTVLPSAYLKKGYEMSIAVSDMKTGLHKVTVTVIQQEKEITLLDKQYEPPGFFSVFFGSKTLADFFKIPIEISKYGMTDGEVIIRITGTDNSLRGWGRGNTSHIEKKLIYDSKPPDLTVLSGQHNIERGGTGLIIYKISEDNIKSGVEVGDNFFPGHSGLFENKKIHACFFALSYLQGPDTKLSLIAEDISGNITKKTFNHYIRDKKYPTDILEISDSFLENKIPDFELGSKEELFEGQDNPLLKKFLYINEDLRKENEDQILKISSDSEAVKHWEGSFSRLARAQRKAGFADHRIYQYKGSEVDRAVHLGIDLASTAHSPVYPANEGKVMLAELIGIFGNTVIIDHGFGLCSLYSHLDQIQVKPGDGVKRETQIGITGLTGMAAGDHLHFSIMVHNVFVNPVEWWDDAWINNNIVSKIKAVQQRPEI